MRDARIATIVTTSGERIAVSEERHPARSYGRMFHTVFDEAVEHLAAHVTSGITMRLFVILPRHLSYTVFKRLDQVTIGAKLKVDHSSISRAMKQLLEIGAVEKRGAGPVTEWRLTPDFSWRGDVDSYHKAQRSRQGGKATPTPRRGHDRLPQNVYYGN